MQGYINKSALKVYVLQASVVSVTLTVFSHSGNVSHNGRISLMNHCSKAF